MSTTKNKLNKKLPPPGKRRTLKQSIEVNMKRYEQTLAKLAQ